jgi:hypothetical protein
MEKTTITEERYALWVEGNRPKLFYPDGKRWLKFKEQGGVISYMYQGSGWKRLNGAATEKRSGEALQAVAGTHQDRFGGARTANACEGHLKVHSAAVQLSLFQSR